MNTLAKWTLGWLVGVGLLLATPAWADRACMRGCEQDAEKRNKLCKKHAGQMAGRCIEASNDEKQACSEECSGRPAKREKLPEDKEGDHDHGDEH
ncbi:hypothetical protein ACLESO_38670 [Pyxidicoccus sp. 3LG]